MSRYRDTLYEWARRYVPEDAVVTDVYIAYDDGYDPTFTDHEPSLTVTISYTHGVDGRADYTYPDTAEVMSTLGGLLSALFAIEDGLSPTARYYTDRARKRMRDEGEDPDRQVYAQEPS